MALGTAVLLTLFLSRMNNKKAVLLVQSKRFFKRKMKHFSSTNVPQGWNLKDSQQRYQVVFMNLEPGASWPKESHPRMDQLFFVVSGTGKAMSGTRSVTLRPGDALTIPAGTEHEVAALESGMKLWTVYTPVEPGVFQHNDPSLKEELRAALVDAPLEFQNTVQSLLHRMEAHDAGIQHDEHAYLLEGAAKEWIELIGRRAGRRARSRRRRSKSRSRSRGRRRSKSRSPKKQGKSKSRSRSRGRRQSKSRSPTKGGARQRKSKSRSKSRGRSKSGGGGGGVSVKKQGKSKSRSRSRGRRQSKSGEGGGGSVSVKKQGKSKSRSRSRRERRRQQRRSQSPSTSRFDTFGPNSSWGTSTDGAPRLYSTTYAPASTSSPRLYSTSYPSAVSPTTTISPPTSPRPTRPVPLPPVSPTVSPPTSPRPTRPVPAVPGKIVLGGTTRYTDEGRATRIEVE